MNQCTSCKSQGCITKVRIFSNLCREETNQILNKFQHSSFGKGEIIFREGSTSQVLYFISSGKVKLYKYTKDGKEQILHVLSEGEFFGELSLLRETKYKFSAKAMDKVKVCTLRKSDMAEIIMKNPVIGIKLLETTSQRLAYTESLVQSLATNNIDTRMAQLLLSLKEKYGIDKEGDITINMPFNREEMANSIGVTRETISRKLKKFEEEALIQLIGTKTIRIIDLESLENYT